MNERRIHLTATNLANHLACHHLTDLDDRARRGELTKPVWHDPALELLKERGMAHERAFVEHLRATGREVLDLGELRGRANAAETERAAHAGVDVIVQANLRDDRFHGYADLLVKTRRASDLGAWSYDVVDTKLAQETRASMLLQLCLYADLLGTIQGRPAERMTLVRPGPDFPGETFRFEDFHAYYRLVRSRLDAFVGQDGRPEVYPSPVPHCDICRWRKRCENRRRDDDHLSLVAGLSSSQATELQRQGITTLAAFARRSTPLPERPRHGSVAAYERIHGQARVQLRGRESGQPIVELLEHEEGRGLSRLPAPDPGDVFLDFEGHPFAGENGLEYLTGFVTHETDGTTRYDGLWALNGAEEKAAFEQFIDFVLDRQERHPALHVYHYAPYEPAALKRLAMRYATREAELDTLLRGKRFVDLYAVTRQGLRASVESYSLKPLEAFFGYEREVELREEASPALRRVGFALEQECPEEITTEDRAAVEGYNRDDCLSLIALQRWLEKRRTELLESGASFDRPPLEDGSGSEQAAERSEEVAAVFDGLIEGLPDDPDEHDQEQAARWLLAHLLEYFHREDKVGWWEYYARKDQEVDDLIDDRKAVVHLEFVEDLGKQGRERTPTHRYRFPPQEVSFSPGDDLHDLYADFDEPHCKVGSVRSCEKGILEIKKSSEAVAHHPTVVHAYDRVPLKPLDGSLLEFGRWVVEHGLDSPKPELRAGRDLLLQRRPRLQRDRDPLRPPGQDSLTSSIELARELVQGPGGLLAIQGPPGAGKTYTGARMILALARDGHRVGISATSHKVIRNLLEAVLKAAAEEGVDLHVAHKPSSRGPRSTDPLPDGLTHVTTKDVPDALDDGKVVGGVAWLWASNALENALDCLFIDEAGQMSLAHVIACARSARSLILLGDPLQLQQPQRGAHPGGAEISALHHLLGSARTMPPDLGLFLAETYRLPPALCSFTSEVFYEGRLASRPHCTHQRLDGPSPFAGAGLFLVPCSHAGNQSSSPEEVEAVVRVVEALLTPGVTWTDGRGESCPLTERDLLVIAPYNAQVAALSTRLPDLDVGTVDRFQGQERPVVLYSMTSSSAHEAPRGMAFLYDLHRLNVATSRAQGACILIGAPALFEPDCRTPDQLRWANGLCRYRELAKVVDIEAS